MSWKYSKKELRRVAENKARREDEWAARRKRVDDAKAVLASAEAEGVGVNDAARARMQAETDLRRALAGLDYGLHDETPLPRWRKRAKGGYVQDRAFLVAGRIAAVVTIGCLLLGGFIGGLVFLIRGISWHLEHNACPRKGEELGVEWKWADYNLFDWDCLANVNGRWVPIGTVNNDTGVWLRGRQQ